MSIPLAFSRRATSGRHGRCHRRRCPWAQPIGRPGVISREASTVSVGGTASSARRRRSWPQAIQAVHRLARQPLDSVWWLAKAGRSPRCAPGGAGAAPVSSPVGPAVLADHRRLFHRRHSVQVWLRLAVLLLSVLRRCDSTCCSAIRATTCSARCRPRSTGIGAGDDTSNSLGCTAFRRRWCIFSCWRHCSSPASCSTSILTQRFILAWRVWLTDRPDR